MSEFDDHEDLLLELVQMPHWKVLKREIGKVQEGLVAKLLQPSATLVDLVEKEAVSGRLATLRDFTRQIEETAERHAKKVRAERKSGRNQ